MSNLQSIIKSFHLQDNLNPKVWYLPDEKYMGNPQGQNYKMRPLVRERLLEIANIFIEFLDVNVIINDITMTGSLANYNWSKYSDVDLHIMADFKQFSEEELPLYKELFTLKKTIFNEKHNITIFGYDVELYLQDSNEPHISTGVYSVLNDEWINKPKKENVEVDKVLIKNKSQQWMDIIDGVIENAEEESIDEAKNLIKKYRDKLKKYRTCGLEKGGEYSTENLVFKILRRNGYIEKLHDSTTKILDKKLSMNQ
jgi:predicted nucleotidyltransferase